MHIALFGGSFDPPHLGHQQIAHFLIEQEIVDELWFVPCFQHPFAKNMSPAADRLAMLKLISIPHTSICTFELHQPQPSYSYDTLRHYRQTQPKDHFSWVIGSDQLTDFPRWHHYTQLLQDFSVYVYPRSGSTMYQLLSGMIPLTKAPMIDLSSTQIRTHCRQQQPIDHLVSPPVAAYIQSHQLYD